MNLNKPTLTAILIGALTAPAAAIAVPLAETKPMSTFEELNLVTLEERLRETKAIPILRKLSLKGEIDDLLARFRSAHAGGRAEVAKLRPSYNSLIDRLYAMLKKDPTLGQDILASRESIWGLLSDRTQFASLN